MDGVNPTQTQDHNGHCSVNSQKHPIGTPYVTWLSAHIDGVGHSTPSDLSWSSLKTGTILRGRPECSTSHVTAAGNTGNIRCQRPCLNRDRGYHLTLTSTSCYHQCWTSYWIIVINYWWHITYCTSVITAHLLTPISSISVAFKLFKITHKEKEKLYF